MCSILNSVLGGNVVTEGLSCLTYYILSVLSKGINLVAKDWGIKWENYGCWNWFVRSNIWIFMIWLIWFEVHESGSLGLYTSTVSGLLKTNEMRASCYTVDSVNLCQAVWLIHLWLNHSYYQFIFHDFIYALQTLPMSLTASTCLKISLPNKFGFGWHFGLIKLITTSIKYIVFLIACSLTSCLCYFWYTSHLTNRRTSAI